MLVKMAEVKEHALGSGSAVVHHCKYGRSL